MEKSGPITSEEIRRTYVSPDSYLWRQFFVDSRYNVLYSRNSDYHLEGYHIACGMNTRIRAGCSRKPYLDVKLGTS